MATISDTSQESARRLNEAARNLGLASAVVKTGRSGFEVTDEVKAEYDRLKSGGSAKPEADASQPSDDTADK